MKVENTSKSTKNRYIDDEFLAKIQKLDDSLYEHFSDKFVVDKNITRKLVSFQANKTHTHYRWYKYKEAFSADLVEYLFSKYDVNKGKILDPFSGVGTALFAGYDLGYDAEGIEILPLGQKIIEANIIARSHHKKNIVVRLDYWLSKAVWNKKGETKDFEVLRITESAYPKETEHKIKRYLYEIEHELQEAKEILLFALLCVLEPISYTRKDGQYLRWDYRANRKNGKNTFNIGKILSFDEAITSKLKEILDDISVGQNNFDLFTSTKKDFEHGKVKILKGSCLNLLPTIKRETYTGIITSPPYCNRYDYTRTYALEHALLGVKENELVSLRQAMLSCTVESKKKDILSFNQE
ncbi:hypothetical protein, partial [Candidatus Parabeggiatoa sp. HSG14]|uniref:hypothetical protein n=1 Tax=Candidatus Parabeggiatoa sp. HSG14 TaxID=3055593 RepID=UPI0025A73B2A|nr:hypothetical protein [Thiotrichales bacterium HSG14]